MISIMKTNQSQKNIPSDWQQVKLGDVLSVRSGKDYKHLGTGDIPVFGTGGYMLSVNRPLHSGETIFVGRKGTIDKPFYFKGDFWTVDTLFYTHKFKNTTAKYINNVFQKIDWKSYNEASGVPSLSKTTIEKIKISLPPLPEQSRIVAVLETWDKSISKLFQKIKIKKQVKRSLMQDLLTGKKRLIGFKDKWQTVEVGELLDYEQPTKYVVSNTDYSDCYNTPVLTANKGFILGYTNETEGIYKNFPVIIFDDFTMDNKFVDFEFKIKSSAIKILTPKNKNVNLKFVFERIQLIDIVIGEHRRHYLSEYQYITIDIPDIKEQNAIAKILTTADKEITELEKKLSIIKEQKRYLLNNLITGTIRTPETLSAKLTK